MNRHLTLAALLLATLSLHGCNLFHTSTSTNSDSTPVIRAEPASRALMDQYLTQIQSLGLLLKTIKDAPTARAQLSEIQSRVTALRATANRIESLEAEQKFRLSSEYNPKLAETNATFNNNARNINDDPQVLKILEPALSRLPVLGF